PNSTPGFSGVPAVPTGFTAVAVSTALVNLNWTAAPGAMKYKVERSQDGTTGWTVIGTPIVPSYADSGLLSNNTYYYRVRASDSIGDSSPSTMGEATTAPWAASYSVASTPSTWTTGQTQTYSVSVTNTGTQTWPSGGANPVHLGVHFANAGGGFGANTWYTDQRFNLTTDLAAGATASFSVSVTAPTTTGNLVLEFHIVNELHFCYGPLTTVNDTMAAPWAASYSVAST